MVVVKIEKKPRSKNIYYVYTSSGDRYEVFDEYVISRHLKSGNEISDNEMQDIIMLSQEKIGQQICMQVLSRSMKTKKELMQKLKDKGVYNKEIIDKILNKICEYGYIDDDKFTQNYVSIEKNRKGLNRIRFELEQKGVDNDIINKYLQEIDDEQDVATSVAQKYMKNKECSYKNKTKLYAHLISKGFSYDVISSVLQNYKWIRDEK